MGNHDIDRVADVMRGNVGRVKIAMTLLATMRGIPQFFTGDEWMMRSVDLSQGHGGLRTDSPGGWPSDKVDYFDAEQLTGDAAAVHAHVKHLFNWRKTKPVIHHGKTLHFGTRDNTYAYFRYDATDAVFVYVNNTRGKRQIPWSNYAEITEGLTEGRNVLTGENVTISDTTTVGPREALIVEFKRK